MIAGVLTKTHQYLVPVTMSLRSLAPYNFRFSSIMDMEPLSAVKTCKLSRFEEAFKFLFEHSNFKFWDITLFKNDT